MSRFRKVVSGIMLALGMAIPVAAFATVSVASFNIQNLGWQNSKDYKTVALITSSFDVVAVQEVMNEEGAERLHRALEKVSGEAWSYMMSHLIGRVGAVGRCGASQRRHVARVVDLGVVVREPADDLVGVEARRLTLQLLLRVVLVQRNTGLHESRVAECVVHRHAGRCRSAPRAASAAGTGT